MLPNKQLLLGEWYQIIRDPLLKWLFLFPIAITLAMRYGLPELNGWLLAKGYFDLSPYYFLILSTLPALVPSIIGMVTGFNLLDMKDDRSLSAMLVTPLQLKGYLRFKLAIPMLLSIPLNLFCLWFANLAPLSLLQLIMNALAPILLAPIIALLLVVVAQNKVQGFALAKVINAITFPPVLAWFYPGLWNWLFGILPTWLPMKAFWLSQQSLFTAFIVVLAGIVVQLIWVLVLFRLTKSQIRV